VDLFIAGAKEPVKIKISKNSNGDIVHIKPEYDDLKRIADKTNLPFREVTDLVMSKAREVFTQTK
jgi:uncharacterized protein (DUF111 family)